MRITHIILGAIALSLGIFGLYDEYFVAVEFIKGSMQPACAVIGIISIQAGLLRDKPKLGHVIFGVVLLGLGIYGFFDEYYAVLDFFKGAVPPFLLLIGLIAVVSGVKQLKME